MTNVEELESKIGERGRALVHSGKRSALRAWVMARSGKEAREILHLGTHELGAIYNDISDAKFFALARPTVALQPHAAAPTAPASPISGTTGQPPRSLGPIKDDASTEDARALADIVKRAEARGRENAQATDEKIRAIAREEDAAHGLAIGKVVDAKIAVAVKNAVVAPSVPNTVVMTGPVKNPVVVDVGACHRMFPLLLKTVQAGLTPALVGPAGSGKTHAAHAVALALGRPWELQGTCVTKSDITGFIDANGHYQSTPFSRSFSNGGVFLADEMDAWSPNATLALNAALANGHTPLPTGMMDRHIAWAPIVAMNTYGTGASRQYVGRNQMDAATINRLAFISWDYDAALESSIVGVPAKQEELNTALGGVPDAAQWVKRVQAIRAACDRLKVRHIVSPRATIGGVKLFACGVGQTHVENMLIWQGMDAEQRRRVENSALQVVL